MKNKRVALYIRVSTNLEGQQSSVEVQREQTAIIESRGGILVDVYTDIGISGSKANRPELDRLLKDCKNGKIDYVFTKNLSRLARNTEFLLRTIREMTDLGVVVEFYEDNIRTDKMTSKLLITVLAAVAEIERENISEHIRAGFRIKRDNGQPATPHQVPYGYKWVKRQSKEKPGYLIIDEEESEIVKWIYKVFTTENRTPDAICKALNNQGLLKRGHIWERSSLLYLLKNPRYKGTVVEQGIEFENQIPALVDVATWDLAQQIIAERRKNIKDTSSNFQSEKYALSKKCKCRICGLIVTRTQRPTPYSDWDGLCDGGEQKIQIWCCTSVIANGQFKRHGAKGFSEYYIYKSIASIIADMIIHNLIEMPEQDENKSISYKAKLKAWEKRNKQIEEAIDKVYLSYEEGKYSEQRRDKQIAHWEEEKAKNVRPEIPEESIQSSAKERISDLKKELKADKTLLLIDGRKGLAPQKTYATKKGTMIETSNLFDDASVVDGILKGKLDVEALNPIEGYRRFKATEYDFEMRILRDFRDEPTKRAYVDYIVDHIEFDNDEYYVFTKQGPVYRCKPSRRTPTHRKSDGKIIPSPIDIVRIS